MQTCVDIHLAMHTRRDAKLVLILQPLVHTCTRTLTLGYITLIASRHGGLRIVITVAATENSILANDIRKVTA
jgi:hypothetical protein